LAATPSDPVLHALAALERHINAFRLSDLWGPDMRLALESLLILAAFVIFRRLISDQVIRRIEAHTKGEKGRRHKIIEALRGPVGWLPFTVGLLLAGRHLHLSKDFALLHMTVVRTLVSFMVFWALYNLVQPLSFVVQKFDHLLTSSMTSWIIKAVKALVVLIGAATILGLWGVQVGPILAGFGLFGVAVALGAQDLFKNLISGLLIIAEKRFNPGDWVRVDNVVEGVVEDIGFRSTLIRRFDKAPVFVPNTALSDQAVTNFTKMTSRRILWTVGVEYRTTIDQLRMICAEIEDYLHGSSDFVQPPDAPATARVDAFGDSSIDILLVCFTVSTEWADWLRIKEALAFRVMEIVKAAGTDFAYPSQTLYIASLPDLPRPLPGDAPERFVPPAPSEAAKFVSPED